MLKLIRDCAPWLNWKIGAGLAALLLIGFFAFGLESRLLRLISAMPLLAILVCLLPCAIPLLFLRRGVAPSATPSRTPDPTADR